MARTNLHMILTHCIKTPPDRVQKEKKTKTYQQGSRGREELSWGLGDKIYQGSNSREGRRNGKINIQETFYIDFFLVYLEDKQDPLTRIVKPICFI